MNPIETGETRRLDRETGEAQLVTGATYSETGETIRAKLRRSIEVSPAQWGFISISLAVLTAVLAGAMFFANSMVDTRFPFTSSSRLAGAFGVAFLVLGWASNMAGIVTGAIGTFQPNRKRDFGIFGLAFNALLMVPMEIMFLVMLLRNIF